MTALTTGSTAPEFQAKDQDGKTIKLSDFKGKKLVLYFYPKDSTPGCTAEACNLRDNYKALLDSGYEIVGVSPDSSASHTKFIGKYDLPFSLLADPDKEILKAYGAWGPKNLYGRMFDGVLRKTFVIDENGKIEKIIDKVKTKDHTAQILGS